MSFFPFPNFSRKPEKLGMDPFKFTLIRKTAKSTNWTIWLNSSLMKWKITLMRKLRSMNRREWTGSGHFWEKKRMVWRIGQRNWLRQTSAIPNSCQFLRWWTVGYQLSKGQVRKGCQQQWQEDQTWSMKTILKTIYTKLQRSIRRISWRETWMSCQ